MKHVIIGNSAAGVNAAEAIRERDQDCEIVIISKEEGPFYSRCLTSYYIAGNIEVDDMLLRSNDFYTDLNIETKFGTEAIAVDEKTHEVVLENKERISFDKLLIATGSSPIKPAINGVDSDGVFTLRTIEDAREIKQQMEGVTKAVIIGGGFVGIKAACALAKNQIEVDVIELSEKLLGYMTDYRTNQIITNKLEANGVNVFTNQSVVEIKDKGHNKDVVLDNGQIIDGELIIVAAGVTPNVDLIKDTDIEVDEGILVDDKMVTTNNDIYAAGDVAQAYDIVSEDYQSNALWPLAVKQGKIAGSNMAGNDSEYDGSIPMNSIDFFGFPVISMGLTTLENGRYEVLAKQKNDNWYRKFILKDNVLKGAIFVGAVEKAGVARSLIEEEVDLTNCKQDLLTVDFNIKEFK